MFEPFEPKQTRERLQRCIYPVVAGSTTRGQLNPEQQAVAGISSALVPLSIGIEDPNDIIADIAHALDGV